MIWYLHFTDVAPTLFMKIEKNTVLILEKNTLIESMYGLNVLFGIQFLQHLGEKNSKIFLCRVFWSVVDKTLIKVPSVEEISPMLKISDCVPVYSDSTNISFHLCDMNFCSGRQVYWFGINFSFFVGNTFLGVFMTAQFQCHLYQVSLGIQTVSALFQTSVSKSANFFLNVFEVKRNA